MKIMKWIIVLVIVVIPALSSAEFYKYVDENGKVRFTDNLANVPDDQRPQVKEYEEAPRELKPKEKAEEPQEPVSKKTKQGTEVVADEKEGLTEEEELEKRGEKLQQEYEALMEERQELDKAAKVRLTPGARKKLAEKIAVFNLHIKDYEEKRQAYNKAVEAHNTVVEKVRASQEEQGLAQE